MKIHQAHRSLRKVDEKPPERSPGVSGDALEHPSDLWAPPADDPLFGPLRGLPSSIRRPVWTPDAGSAVPDPAVPDPAVPDQAVPDQAAPGTADPPSTPVNSAAAAPTGDPAGLAATGPVATGSAPSATSMAATDGMLMAVRDLDARDDARRTPAPVRPVTRGYIARLIIVAGIVAALVIASVVIVAKHDSRSNRPISPPVATAGPGPAGPGSIDSVRTDSDPVTASEFFAADQVTVNFHSYRRLGYRLEVGCPGITDALAGALPGDRCRQLVHAVYVSESETSGRRVLAAVSVLVLDEATTAANAASLVAAGKGGVPAVAVPTEALPGAVVTNPTGDNSWRNARVSGHYLIVLQLAYTDGSQGAATDAALSSASRDLALLAIDPITRRALTGHGPH